MKNFLFKTTKTLLNLLIFVSASFALAYIVWTKIGFSYVYSDTIVGGDWFNAYLYLHYFAKYLPLPPWLPYFNGGDSVIGGYSAVPFYITLVFAKFRDLATAMNLFSITSLLLFCISSLALFYQISKNWLISLTFSTIIITTQATYYQLTVGGFIASAAIQWYLPITLFFIFKFFEKHRIHYLTLATFFCGFSLLMHAPASLLMVLPPAAITLLFDQRSKTKSKIIYIIFFLIVSLAIGSLDLYTVFLQTFWGSGTSKCTDPQCWGVYPLHLQRWLNVLSPLVVFAILVTALIIKIPKRTLNLRYAIPATAAFIGLSLYAVAAYFKLIDSIANVVFPTRIFWALNLLLLTIGASLFYSIQKLFPKIAQLLALLLFLITAFATLSRGFHPAVDRPNVIPINAAEYSVPRYQTKSPYEIIPEWILNSDRNWRIDVLNAPIEQWLNLVTENPITRGYSNLPLGEHKDWHYFLQFGTRLQQDDGDLEKNRTLFLLDAYGIKFINNSNLPYQKSITDDREIIINHSDNNFESWYEVSEKHTTPIIYPTNSPTMLFIGEGDEYMNFVKILAMQNLNSRFLIPIKGPTKLDDISENELKKFNSVYIHNSKFKNTNILQEFLKNGGSIFIGNNFVSTDKQLPQIFPAEAEHQSEAAIEKNYLKNDPEIKIDIEKFSAFSYKNKPWKHTYFSNVKPWAKTLLTINDKPVIIGGKIENGSIYLSGLNLTFHAVQNNNFEESKFLGYIFELLNPPAQLNPQYKVTRDRPEEIHISGNNIKGVYFKENFDSGWKASSKNQQLKIYKAGLEFMYISVPNQGDEIKIWFIGNPMTLALIFVSAFSSILTIIYVFFPKPLNWLITNVISTANKKLGRKFGNFFEDEV